MILIINENHCPKYEFFTFRAVINLFNMKSKLIFISLLFALFFPLIVLTAKAQNISDTVGGLNNTANTVTAFSGQVKPASDTTSYGTDFLATQAGKYIGLILSFVGVLFLGLMIYAGLSWMTSDGNEQTVSKAKTMIINAAIGIIIVFAAYAATAFLGGELLK